MTTTTVLHDWSEFMYATGRSPATVRIRLHAIQALTRHAGKTDPLTLTRRDVLSFLARPRKQWTKVTYWRCVRAWGAWLTEFDYPHEELLRGIPRPRTPAAAARPIEDADITRLLASRMTHRTRCYVVLALYGGLRVHEIAKLRAEDFDLQAGWLTVTGKGNVTKPIPIHPEIAAIAARMPEAGYWFPSQARLGEPVSAIAVSQTITNALRASGCNATAHMLRDTAATNLQRTVKDIRLTQAFLRHTNVTSTAKYCAVSDAALQSAVTSVRWAA
jgi:integrase/recombinase XerD